MENETKTVDSIISDAMKEGIDYSGRREETPASSEPTPTKDVTPAPSAKVEGQTNEVSKTPAAEKSVETEFAESKLPAHLFPRFKELYAEKKALDEKLKAQDAILKDPRVARLLAQGKLPEEVVAPKETPKPVAPQGQMNDEQKQALDQLRSMLGIDESKALIEELKRKNEELSKREEDKAFDAEEVELKKLASENGLDWDSEVHPELTKWLHANKQFQGFGPGILKFAFNNVFFSRMGELAERKKNLEMIEQQRKLKSGNAETPSKTGKPNPAVKTYKNDDDMIQDLVRQAGGLDNIDFNA